MAKLYITFGQVHTHRVNSQTFDKDCVGVVTAPTIEAADAMAFKLFDGKFHQHIDAEKWDEDLMKYFPRGYIDVN